MRELAEMGHRCLIVTSDSNQWAEVPEFEGPRLLEERDGLEVCWLRTLKSRKARSFARMLGWLHFEWAVLRMPTRGLPPPDVVVVSSLSLLTVLSGIVLRRRHRARLVVEIRDIWPLTLVEEGGLSPHNPIIKLLGWVERLGYRKADAIVGTMPNLGEHVEHVLGSPKPTYCIPMGYAPRFVSARPVRGAGQVAIPAPPGALVVGYAGTVGTTNALEPLFLAAEKMSAETGVHFVVLGDGDLLADYQRRFAHLRNLSFVAKVPKADVSGILDRCDVLYLSTFESEVWRYGQSLNKLIDYMLAGKPVLASYSGFPSMIDEAECGSLIPAEDVPALIEEVRRYAAMSAAEREEMGHRGRDWILEHRSFRRLAKAYEAVLFPAEPARAGGRAGSTRAGPRRSET